MSIFVSIATLVDNEIFNTIKTAFDSAENADDVYIGIACTTEKLFFKEIISSVKNNSNVIVDWYDPKTNIGIGKGRILSRKRYDNQDNILQVDSHTLFRDGWDTTLKSLWKECLEETKNHKTVMTAYLPRYKVSEGIRLVDDGQSRYSPFLPNNQTMPQGIINWGDVPISEFPKKYNKKFLPSNKTNGNFIFSNKYFVEDSGITEDAKFFEEDIIQSIGLLSSGFSLVFPNTVLPLHHLYLYHQDTYSNKRQMQPFSFEEMNESMSNYINNKNNLWKCRLWEQYAHANLRESSAEPWYIPENFKINIGG